MGQAASDIEDCDGQAESDLEDCDGQASSDIEDCDGQAASDLEDCDGQASSDFEVCDGQVVSDPINAFEKSQVLHKCSSPINDESDENALGEKSWDDIFVATQVKPNGSSTIYSEQIEKMIEKDLDITYMDSSVESLDTSTTIPNLNVSCSSRSLESFIPLVDEDSLPAKELP